LADQPISRRLGIVLLLVMATVFCSNHVAARIAFDHGANVATAVAFCSTGTALAILALLLLTALYRTAITSMFVLLPRLGMVNNAAVLNFEPIAVLAIAWVVLGQAVAPLQIAGAFVVVGAIMWMGSGKR
jgi:hypothetical protein